MADELTADDDLQDVNANSAFMRIIRLSFAIGEPGRTLYAKYDEARKRDGDGWDGVIVALVDILEEAITKPNSYNPRVVTAATVKLAIREALEFKRHKRGFGRCAYVGSTVIAVRFVPVGTERISRLFSKRYRARPLRTDAHVWEGGTEKFFGHYFICRYANKPAEWCPEHDPAARQRKYRKKRLKRPRVGKFIY